MNMEKKYSAPAVKKVLEILELMARSNRSFTVSEISNELDISVNSAFRIYKELEEKDYVTKDPSDSSYELTPKLYYIGCSIKNNILFVKSAQPYMKKIRKYTGETVLLTILSKENGTLVVDQMESKEPIKFLSTVGIVYDSYTSAMGKAMLAELEEDEINEYLDKYKFIKKTDKTIIDKQIFKKELKKIAESKVAFDKEENFRGLSCIASAVFSGEGNLEGAIGISGLTFRMDEKTIEKYAEFIREQAEQFSASLGYEKR